jgi:hypothetical protein
MSPFSTVWHSEQPIASKIFCPSATASICSCAAFAKPAAKAGIIIMVANLIFKSVIGGLF